MFECNKCANEETEECYGCVDISYKPSNWKRKDIDIGKMIKEKSEIDVRKCSK